MLSATLGSASAAPPGWLGPVGAPPSTWSVDAQDVGVDGAGGAVAVWTANGPPPSGRVTQAATRPVGGTWSAPVTLSPEGEDGGWDPAVAVGPAGDAVAVWSSVRKSSVPGSWTRQLVLAATRDAGSAGWSEPVALSDTDEIAISYQPDVVLDGDGSATAIWGEEVEDAIVVRTRTRPRGGEWSAPVDLTDDAVAWEPQLAVEPDGDVTAVWNLRTVPENAGGIIQSKHRPAGEAWSAETIDLSGIADRATEPRIAVNPSGESVVVWGGYSPGERVVQAARRDAAGLWAPADDLVRGDPRASLPDVALDVEGTATVVWESVDATGVIIRSRTAAQGGPWSAPVDISNRDEGPWPGAFPQVVVDRHGAVTASWSAWYPDRSTVVEAARREPDSPWQPPVELGPSNGVIEPRPMAVDPQGYATVVWARGKALQSAVYDPVPPLLRAVSIPADGIAGQPVTMWVDAYDLWSPVSASWAFGENEPPATGTAIRHCFSAPGARSVTVTGTDAAGNTTSATDTIEIAADPAVPPGTDPCAPPTPDPDPGPGPDPNPDPGPDPDPGPGPRPDPPDPAPGPGPGPGPVPSPGAAPVISGLRQSSTRWRTPRAHGRSMLPTGTTFHYRLDRAAKVQLSFTQIIAGRRAGARCVRQTNANRSRRRCNRLVARGSLRLTGRTGANTHTFRGKLGRRTLAPGRYRLRATARADGKTSKPAMIDFTIAR